MRSRFFTDEDLLTIQGAESGIACFLMKNILVPALSSGWFYKMTHILKFLNAVGFLLLVASSALSQVPESRALNQTKDWAYIQNEHLRVGFLRSHGGAIAHLSTKSSDVNLLNHYDHGRLIQQSYYGDEDGTHWVDKPWRYNPVQGGDYKGNAAIVANFESSESSAYAKTFPRHWSSGDLLDECVMEQWAELDGPILRVRYKFVYSGDQIHKARHQETPAVFVSPALTTLVTYSGDEPWKNSPLIRKSPRWPNEPVTLSESWAAYVGEDGNGIGIYVPGTTEATCYRFQGGSGSDCSYIAPLKTFALIPKLSFEYTAFFTLGNADTIRERFSKLR